MSNDAGGVIRYSSAYDVMTSNELALVYVDITINDSIINTKLIENDYHTCIRLPYDIQRSTRNNTRTYSTVRKYDKKDEPIEFIPISEKGLKFNYVLVLNSDSSVAGYYKLLSAYPIDEFKTKYLYVNMCYEIVEDSSSTQMSLDIISHSHRGLLTEGFPDTKAVGNLSIRDRSTDYNPFFCKMNSFLSNDESIIRYSGNFLCKSKSSKKLDEGTAELILATYYSINKSKFNKIFGILDFNGDSYLAFTYDIDSKFILLQKQFTEFVEGDAHTIPSYHSISLPKGYASNKVYLSNGKIVVDYGTKISITTINSINGNDTYSDTIITLDTDIKVIQDGITKRIYFYKDGEYISSELYKIVYSLGLGSNSIDGNIIAATDGLVVSLSGNNLLLYSYYNLSQETVLNYSNIIDMSLLTNKAFLLTYGSSSDIKYDLIYLQESDEDSKYNVRVCKIGDSKYLKNIDKFARCRLTNPYSKLVMENILDHPIIHDGLLHRIEEMDGQIKIITV